MNPLTPTGISERMQQIEGTLSGVGEKMKETATLPLHKAGSLSDAITANVQNSVQAWIDIHPIFAWILLHPLWSVGLAILVLWLAFSLLTALVDATVQLISPILKLPFTGFKRLLLPRRFVKPDSSQRLMEVLDRLEALRQEQDDLLKQVKTMLASERNVNVKEKSVSADQTLSSKR
jgi:Fe2+ transport system protein B